MRLSLDHINAILVRADIEGLIAEGAPRDEYASEAQALFHALEKRQAAREPLDAAVIAACLALIWASAFSLSPEDVRKRLNAFRTVAGAIADAMSRG